MRLALVRAQTRQAVALAATRAGAVLLAGLAVLVWSHSVPVWFAAQTTYGRSLGLATADFISAALLAIYLAAVVLWLSLMGVIFWRRWARPYPILAGIAGIYSIMVSLAIVRAVPDTDPWFPVTSLAAGITNIGAVFVLYTFPSGRFVPRWSVFPFVVFTAWQLLRVPVPAVAPPSLGFPGFLVLLVFFVSGVVAQGYRYRTSTSELERRQLRTWLPGISVYVVGYASLIIGSALTDPADWVLRAVLVAGYYLTGIFASTTLALAILRDSLFDIDVAISRALVYAGGGAIVVSFLATLTATLERARETTGLPAGWPTLGAVAGTAIAFLLMRGRVRDLVENAIAERGVATLLFNDIVGSTTRVAQIGDAAWRRLLDAYRSTVRRQLARYGGYEIDATGDEFLATFERPASAIACAVAIRDALRAIGLETRTGVHTGECEMQGRRVIGLAVHIGARIRGTCQPGEIVMSSAVRDLAGMPDVGFSDRGEHELRGVPERWRLYTLE